MSLFFFKMRALMIFSCGVAFLLWTSFMRVEAHGRIIGGSDALAGQFPFMGAITVQTSASRFSCSGAIVSNLWIITAGTCVNNATVFTILLGTVYLNGSDGQVVSTSTYVVHPHFDPETLRADVGLIRFRIEISQSGVTIFQFVFTNIEPTQLLTFWLFLAEYIRPILTHGLAVDENTEAFSIGWGQTSDFSVGLSNRLQYVGVTVLNEETCKRYYGEQITDSMMCVEGIFNQGICIGDNGGPLYFNRLGLHWILGIASFISGNGCESTEPSGYTRVEPYLDWIDSYIQNLSEEKH